MSLPRGICLLICLAFAAPPAMAAPYFVHCYDFRCKTTQQIQFTPAQWRRATAPLTSGELDSFGEKQAIRQTVANLEQINGQIAGTYRDKAGNWPGYDVIKQMDCIDESTNTFQYLSALEEYGLLKHHRVDLKQRRIVWFISHWTATIVDLADNRRFAVDSWYRDNGEPPYLQPIEDWQRKLDWPPAYNPELAAN